MQEIASTPRCVIAFPQFFTAGTQTTHSLPSFPGIESRHQTLILIIVRPARNPNRRPPVMISVMAASPASRSDG